MYNEQKVINWFAVKSDVNQKLFPDRANRTYDLTQLRLMKLLYFAQGTYLALYDEQLFDDKAVHATNGPMFEEAHKLYRGCISIKNEIKWDQAIDDFTELNSLPKVNIVLNSVFNKYADVPTSKLVEITHKQDPWKNTESGRELTPKALKDYFKKNVVC